MSEALKSYLVYVGFSDGKFSRLVRCWNYLRTPMTIHHDYDVFPILSLKLGNPLSTEKV
jgi:hypothetical protein